MPLTARGRGPATAQAMFDTLASQNRYAILYRVDSANPRHPGRRIEQFVAVLARGETVYPQSARSATNNERGVDIGTQFMQVPSKLSSRRPSGLRMTPHTGHAAMNGAACIHGGCLADQRGDTRS